MDGNKNRSLMLGELATVLRCCNSNAKEGGGCLNCPLKSYRDQHKLGDCAEQAGLMAAQELVRLQNATESICQRELNEMIKMAKECNLALDRGLAGVSDADFAKVTEHQQVLTELGRQTVVHAEPVKEHGWMIDWIVYEGREVYRREGNDDA